ncbi:MAG TPA: PspC domain-containing protein [Methanosarcina sp.]|nr:PspC domain-containing protein [Methanosarcina sp.]
MNKLYRSKKNRIIAGVCGGIGEYFKVDPTLIRLLLLLISIVGAGSGIVAYIIAWIIIPEES